MSAPQTPFEKFDADCQSSGTGKALDNLADYLNNQQRFHELFEVRKLQLRQQLGLPIDQWQAIDELPVEQGQKLESGLLEICREIGTSLLEIGQVSEGWQYLEPVGDRVYAAALLRKVHVTDENVEPLIQVSVGQGIEPELGFRHVLDRFGTCSSITTYESMLAMQPLKTRRGPAVQLVNHLYTELVNRVKTSIGENEEQEPTGTLAEMILERDWMFEGLGHHIDTTHLASIVRISRIVTDQVAIQKAIELAEYGSKLHADFQYQGEAPFDETYVHTLEFLRALQGKDQAAAITRLSNAADVSGGGFQAAVWLVYLLDQLEQGEAATREYLNRVHQQQQSETAEDVCPNLMYLVNKYGQFNLAKNALSEMGDLLSYATAVSIEQQV